MVAEILKDIEDRMDKSIKNLEKEFIGIRTGRANPAILDSVKVDVYGTLMPIAQMATITCPEPRLLMVQPWDKNNLSSLEKAILKSDLSLNPNSDGNVIRIQIPDLTEERRKEYVKIAKQKSEDCKISIRNIRRDGNDAVKVLEKDKEISEDGSKDAQAEIQIVTDKFVEIVKKLTENKEKEILSL